MVGSIQGHSQGNNAGSNTNQNGSRGASQVGTYHRWPNCNKMHFVPFGFVWPQTLSLNIVWGLWFFGDHRLSIMPFRHIGARHDLVTKKCKVMRSRCAGVMNKLASIAIDGNKITRLRDINQVNSQDIFLYAFQTIIPLLYETPCRPEDLVVDTVYEKMRKKNLLLNHDDNIHMDESDAPSPV